MPHRKCYGKYGNSSVSGVYILFHGSPTNQQEKRFSTFDETTCDEVWKLIAPLYGDQRWRWWLRHVRDHLIHQQQTCMWNKNVLNVQYSNIKGYLISCITIIRRFYWPYSLNDTRFWVRDYASVKFSQSTHKINCFQYTS